MNTGIMMSLLIYWTGVLQYTPSGLPPPFSDILESNSNNCKERNSKCYGNRECLSVGINFAVVDIDHICRELQQAAPSRRAGYSIISIHMLFEGTTNDFIQA